MKRETITKRFNLAANFFADTKDVDYAKDLISSELVRLDVEYQEDVHMFPELKKFGY